MGLLLPVMPLITVSCFNTASIDTSSFINRAFKSNKLLSTSQLEQIKDFHFFRLSEEGKKKTPEEINKIFDEIMANARNNFNEVETNPNFKKYFLFKRVYINANHTIEYKITRKNGKPAIEYTIWCLDRIQNGKRLTEAREYIFLDLY